VRAPRAASQARTSAPTAVLDTPKREDQPDPQRVPRCQECGGETREEVVEAAFWHDRRLIVIEDIPARVCNHCGEQLYDDQTAQRLYGLIAATLAKPREQVLVPVYSLAGVEPSEEGP
jgi:YgiT-type zinc finger domain-containing protein